MRYDATDVTEVGLSKSMSGGHKVEGLAERRLHDVTSFPLDSRAVETWSAIPIQQTAKILRGRIIPHCLVIERK